MFEELDRNIAFIDDAQARGEETLLHLCPVRHQPLMVSGPAESIRLLDEILADYTEMLVNDARLPGATQMSATASQRATASRDDGCKKLAECYQRKCAEKAAFDQGESANA